MGILDFLFKRKSTTKNVRFDFEISEASEKIPVNKWYQKKSSKNKNYVSYIGEWGSDWKYAPGISGESNVTVAGISKENRTKDFLKLSQLPDFKMFLENDPKNPVNKNARKVMVSASVNGELDTKHIGYLPDKIANRYAGVELNISPKTVSLPTSEDQNVGVEVTLLQRSARYLKKKAEIHSILEENRKK